jgi:VWFA-related protein
MMEARRAFAMFAALLLSASAFAQTGGATAPQASDGKVYLDVVVTAKSGPPVAGLQQQDFIILDNKAAQPISSFKPVNGPQAPIEVILLIDAVNTSYQTVAFERQQIDGFLKANGGHLPHPMTLAVLNDTGTQIQQNFSTDGIALAASLDSYVVGLRSINRAAGFYGAAERWQISLNALQGLVVSEARRPGRKIILWVSPGWPLLTGPRIETSDKQQQQLFSEIIGLSTQLRQANVTLYNISPQGAGNVGRDYYYQEFLKGVSKPSQVQPGDLSLQVLATQSGGLVLYGSNDVSGFLQKCIDDTDKYYELSFQPIPGERRDEYHQLEIKVGKPGLTARTRTGYYSQP